MAFDYGITSNPLPITEHSGVFDRVIVYPDPATRGGNIAAWWLNSRKFTESGPYVFYLEWAEHPDADFAEVAGPTTESTLTDATQRRYSKLPHSVYRVRVNTPGGDYYSSPHPVMGNLNRHDYLLTREIIRREYLSLLRYTGTAGSYLARKQWGELCPDCTDYNTDMPVNSHCLTCYGTGITGGYHSASVLYVGEDRLEVRAERNDTTGPGAPQTQLVRAVACPYLTSKDIWVHGGTGERWSIEKVTEQAAIRGVPLVWSVELRLIEPNSIVYDIGLSGTTSSSS